MYRLHVTEHSDECKNTKPVDLGFLGEWDKHRLCENNYFEFVFYADFDFYLVTVPNCLLPKYANEPEKKRFMIEIMYKQKKLKCNVQKSWEAGKKLKAMMRGDAEINELQYEVNAVYENLTGKQYAIVTKKHFIDFVINQDTLRDNYEKAIQYLKDIDRERFVDEVTELYYYNAFERLEPAILVKTIDHLTKQLKNGNNKTSQL